MIMANYKTVCKRDKHKLRICRNKNLRLQFFPKLNLKLTKIGSDKNKQVQ